MKAHQQADEHKPSPHCGEDNLQRWLFFVELSHPASTSQCRHATVTGRSHWHQSGMAEVPWQGNAGDAARQPPLQGPSNAEEDERFRGEHLQTAPCESLEQNVPLC